MAKEQPKPEPREESKQMPIDPQQAAEAVNETTASQPKWRFRWLVRIAEYGALLLVLLVLLAIFFYWNVLRTPRLRISKETTYITEPLTSDGTRVDYFAAWEREFYPSEMQTDDNGYRLIVRALGSAMVDPRDPDNDDSEAHAAQICARLGLDPMIGPTMTFSECDDILREHGLKSGDIALQFRAYEPWTLDDLPMLASWLEANTPALDLVGEAVRRPTFFIPPVRPSKEETLQDIYLLMDTERMRSFARILAARANYRIGTGDVDGAIHDVISCQRLGRHMRYQGTMLYNLVGLALEGMAAATGVAGNLDSQPTTEQLRHLVDELDAMPPPPAWDRTLLAARYATLDALQAAAHSDEPLAAFFSTWRVEKRKPACAAYVSIDWNIVMQRVNATYDDRQALEVEQPPAVLPLDKLFIGERSQVVADYMAGFCMPTFQGADHSWICQDNLRRIALAMLIYQHQHGTLPPAYTVDSDGKPLHSWRVLLLPYLGGAELYGQLRLDEPWDSKHNRQFHDATVAFYQCPSAELPPGQTTYSVVFGPNTPFQAAEGKSLDLFGKHLILVVERRQPICWMAPTSELTMSVALKDFNHPEKGGIGSPHGMSSNACLRNGSAEPITVSLMTSFLQSLLEGTAKQPPN